MHINTLIELAIQRALRNSLRGLADQMGVSSGILSQWKLGNKPIPDDRIQQLAKIAGQDPGPWLLLIRSEQDGGELGREWAKLYKRLAGTAVLAALAIGIISPAFALDPLKTGVEVTAGEGRAGTPITYRGYEIAGKGMLQRLFSLFFGKRLMRNFFTFA